MIRPEIAILLEALASTKPVECYRGDLNNPSKIITFLRADENSPSIDVRISIDHYGLFNCVSVRLNYTELRLTWQERCAVAKLAKQLLRNARSAEQYRLLAKISSLKTSNKAAPKQTGE